jgi:hypothetical protein
MPDRTLHASAVWPPTGYDLEKPSIRPLMCWKHAVVVLGAVVSWQPAGASAAPATGFNVAQAAQQTGPQYKDPESGATSPSGSGAVGSGEIQGQQRDSAPAKTPPVQRCKNSGAQQEGRAGTDDTKKKPGEKHQQQQDEQGCRGERQR